MRGRFGGPLGGPGSPIYDRPPWPRTPSTTTSLRSGSGSGRSFGASSRRPPFELWIEPLQAVSAQGDTLHLAAPQTTRAWVERRYLASLEAALQASGTGLERVVFVAEGRGPSQATSAERSDRRRRVAAARSGPHVRALRDRRAATGWPTPPPWPSPSCRARPTTRLFLHGPPGLGKTHLLGAIVDYLRRRRPELTVHYTTAERFTTEFVGGAPQGRAGALQAALPRARRAADRRCPGARGQGAHPGGVRPHVQRPPRRRQADRALQRPPAGGDRPGGGAAPRPLRLGPVRRACLPRPAYADGASVANGPGGAMELADPASLREIAARVLGNVRRLQGAMTRVAAFSSMLSEPVTPSLARRALESAPADESRLSPPRPTPRTPPSVDAIQEAVCTAAASPAMTCSHRSAPRGSPRRASSPCTCARELTSLSLAQIAREFNRDHSTVLHAIRTVTSAPRAGLRDRCQSPPSS